MASTADIRVGTAGWSIPRAAAVRFDSSGTNLERYSHQLYCAEINSSFHRQHAATTYAKWRDSTGSELSILRQVTAGDYARAKATRRAACALNGVTHKTKASKRHLAG
jgi:hypothetical protein